MDLASIIEVLGPGLPAASLAKLRASWRTRVVPAGGVLATQGQPAANEVMLLGGKIVSEITDSEGRGVCVGFCKGPGFVAPHISRTREGISLVTLQTTTDATIA